MAFANQIRPDVPNQMGSFTPQNAEGLGVPWGKAMFNLPRYQMPGSSINFGGGFGPNQGGGGGGVQPTGGVKFSISRTASSDPVENIVNDVQNPLGGTNVDFSSMGQGQSQPQAGGLKQRMMGGAQASGQPNQYDPFAPIGIEKGNPAFTIGTPNFQQMSENQAGGPFAIQSLKNRLMAQQPVFI